MGKPTLEEVTKVKNAYAAARNKSRETLKSTGRPIIKNKDNTISTEESITISAKELNKGKHTNIPTIVNGKRVSEKEAIEHAIKNQGKNKYASFESVEEAVEAAKKRSTQLGKDYEAQKRGK